MFIAINIKSGKSINISANTTLCKFDAEKDVFIKIKGTNTNYIDKAIECLSALTFTPSDGVDRDSMAYEIDSKKVIQFLETCTLAAIDFLNDNRKRKLSKTIRSVIKNSFGETIVFEVIKSNEDK